MAIDKKRDRMEDLFMNKQCRVKGSSGGSETVGSGKDAVTRIIRGQEFGTVVGIEIFGPPSGWSWSARLVFADGTLSGNFERFSDVEVKKQDTTETEAKK